MSRMFLPGCAKLGTILGISLEMYLISKILFHNMKLHHLVRRNKTNHYPTMQSCEQASRELFIDRVSGGFYFLHGFSALGYMWGCCKDDVEHHMYFRGWCHGLDGQCPVFTRRVWLVKLNMVACILGLGRQKACWTRLVQRQAHKRGS